MQRPARIICLLASALLGSSLLIAAGAPPASPETPPQGPPQGPPATPTVGYVHRLFGMAFADPYYWMEADGPKFDAWLAAQSAYTRARLDAIPGRATLRAQLATLGGGETQVSGATRAGGYFVYSKTRPQDAVPKIFIRPVAGGDERVLIDPSRFNDGGQAAQLDYWSISPDGHHVAYGVSIGGAE